MTNHTHDMKWTGKVHPDLKKPYYACAVKGCTAISILGSVVKKRKSKERK